MIRVALDAMGGDHAPQAEIEGALAALAALPGDFTIQLVGRVDVIEAELARHPGADRSRLECIEAPDVVGMAEKPLAAVRKKPKSSLMVGIGLQKAGQSDAFISAGNTGRVARGRDGRARACTTGVMRATVATPFPTADDPVVVLDGGANVDCSRPGAGGLRVPGHGLRPRRAGQGRRRSSACSTSARRTRRAPRW